MSRLLSPDESGPVIVHNSGARAPELLICDHAGRRIPRRLDDLGLEPEALNRHIAWDIGAAELACRLADLLGAELVMQVYSRLVADCNRAPSATDIAPETSDHIAIPGNVGISAAELAARIEAIHAPYHAAIAAALDRRGTERPVLVSIHSFTPAMNGFQRPWQVGVLHSRDSRASERALAALGRVDGLVVGDNQPYAMDGIDYTVPRHAKARGLDYLELEIRQDLIADPDGQAGWAKLLAPVIVEATRPDVAQATDKFPALP